jgi:hypothetical protein
MEEATGTALRRTGIRRRCYHCGAAGHVARACPSSALPRSEAGVAALHEYVEARGRLAREREAGGRNVSRVVEWMGGGGGGGGGGGAGENCCWPVRDPVAALRAEAEAAGGSGDAPPPTQRWLDLHNGRRRDVRRSYRHGFNTAMDVIRPLLAERLGVSADDEAASEWAGELTRAVREGVPADFSARGDDGANDGASDGASDGEGGGGEPGGTCLKVYAVEKLSARCRQLHHLLFDDNAICGRAREMLLPRPSDPGRAPDPVRVVSLGGGPGYDHVALCLVARYLLLAQPFRWAGGPALRARTVATEVFDLYDEAWAPVAAAVAGACRDGIGRIDGVPPPEEEKDEDEEEKDELEEGGDETGGDSCSMAFADLRLGADHPSHAALREALELADLVVLQFVLHENAAFLLRDGGDRVGGALGDLLAVAPVGTLVFCTDSANTLWPALRRTASERGWSCVGVEEQRAGTGRIALGPKSFVMLERIARE